MGRKPPITLKGEAGDVNFGHSLSVSAGSSPELTQLCSLLPAADAHGGFGTKAAFQGFSEETHGEMPRQPPRTPPSGGEDWILWKGEIPTQLKPSRPATVERVQKTVCLQLMPTRLSDLRWHSPVEMQVDLQRFPVSIRALPDALKVHAEIISLFIVVLFVFSSEVTR